MPPTAATKKTQSYSVDLSLPSEDKLIDPTNFEKFLLENIKVATKKNNLGTAITVSTKKEVITVTTSIPFAKRYLKYLTKKYLKKENLRDYVRVLAGDKNSYKLKFFQVSGDGNADEE